MNRPYVVGAWWDATGETDARNGYNPKTEEQHAQFRIVRLHFWWGIQEDA
jgi:hypothetical protein